MRISINIDGQSLAVSPKNSSKVRNDSATVMHAVKPVFDQDVKEESPSLENRVLRLAADLNDLTPDQIGEEVKACKKIVTDLSERIDAMEFTLAFPIVEQLTGGK